MVSRFVYGEGKQFLKVEESFLRRKFRLALVIMRINHTLVICLLIRMCFFSFSQPFRSYFSHGMISSHITDNRYQSLFLVKLWRREFLDGYLHISDNIMLIISFRIVLILHLVFAYVQRHFYKGIPQIFVGFNSVDVMWKMSL